MSDTMTTARQREVVEEHIRGENNGDWTTVYDTFLQDGREHFEVVPMGAKFEGIEGIRGFYKTVAQALPDFHIEVVSEYDVPGYSIREIIATGTHKGDFAGVKPLGKSIRIPMAIFFTYDSASEKLISERVYYDRASMVAQMEGTA